MNQVAAAPTPASLQRIALNLAEEGVPVRAIARAVKMSAEVLRESFDEAKRSGALTALPKDDWPSSGARDNAVDLFQTTDENALALVIVRLYDLTNLQAAMLICMVKRKEVTREALYNAVLIRRGDAGGTDGGDIKIVDVVICKLRKRLTKFNLKINTIWGRGYFMTPEDRQRVRDAVLKHITTDGVTQALEYVPTRLSEK